MNVRHPSITASDPEGQLIQIRAYLIQLAEYLNHTNGTIRQSATAGQSGKGTGQSGGENIEASTLSKLKSLIIKSADIVEAYSEQISKRLDGKYVAVSDFGTYKESTEQTIVSNSNRIDLLYSDLQEIISEVQQIGDSVILVNANVRTGLLFYMGEDGRELAPGITEGTPVYGMEIGQENEVNGVKTFDKYARFTAYGVMLYDENGNEAAYITDRKLHITHARILGSLTVGGFTDSVEADGSVVTRWVGV